MKSSWAFESSGAMAQREVTLLFVAVKRSRAGGCVLLVDNGPPARFTWALNRNGPRAGTGLRPLAKGCVAGAGIGTGRNASDHQEIGEARLVGGCKTSPTARQVLIQISL